MTREQGLEIVKDYAYKYPKNLNKFLKWIGISGNSFNYLIDQHRNKKMWSRNENWEWVLNDNYLLPEQNSVNRLKQVEEFTDFVITPSYESTDKKDDYILIGKGFV
jgi:hypothetical protein